MKNLTNRMLCGLAAAALCTGIAHAQTPENPTQEKSEAQERGPDVVIVTATKQAGGRDVQDVPLAITALGSDQLDEKQVRNLENLSYSVPNVQLNAVGTVPATANFSIRGLGVNSSIQSIEPTVGVFVDGMYLGMNVGVLFDTFDLAGVEVLRGPQGLLFGKNVTGGAVVVRTTDPSNTPTLDARASVETGLNYTASAVASGPLGAGFSGKLGVYYNKDEGWFTNKANGDDSYGGGDTTVVRGALRYEFAGGAQSILRLEYGEANQDSEPPSQNRARYSADTFDLEGSNVGYGKSNWKQAIWQTDIPVAFGDGVITNIAAYREVELDARNDVDSVREFYLHGGSIAEQDQTSDELRYSGKLGPVDLTAGVFYFKGNLLGLSISNFGDGVNATSTTVGGGDQTSETKAVFASADWHVSDTVTLNLGARYTEEAKDARVASVRVNGCVIATRACNFDYAGKVDTSNFSPKLGIQWQPSAGTQLYASYTKGFRSGAFNFRAPAPTAEAVGPTRDEKQNAYEVGFKTDLADRLARLNGAIFYSEMSDLQRDVIYADPIRGPLQTFRNTADAVIQGVEFETQIFPTDALTLTAQIGITDGYYTTVLADLNRDGVVNVTDKNLKLPRLSPLTWGVGAVYVWDVPGGSDITGRVDFNHRDAAAVNDSNTAFFSPADMVDASLTWRATNGVSFSLFGRNLLDEVTEGYISLLPATWGGAGATQAPLNKGRVVGVSVRYKH